MGKMQGKHQFYQITYLFKTKILKKKILRKMKKKRTKKNNLKHLKKTDSKHKTTDLQTAMVLFSHFYQF